MLNFALHLKTRIHFGKGAVENLRNELKSYKRILLVMGGGSIKKYGIYDQVMAEISAARAEAVELSGVQPNPTLDSVHKGIELCKENNVEFILAVGGGSVIDAAKAIAAGVVYGGEVWDIFLDGSKFKGALPIGCILTLSATGSETNGNSVVTNEKTMEKLPMRQQGLRPEFAILDPTYTYTLPEYQTTSGIADIMAHAFEQYFSPEKDTYLTDRMTESVMKTCIHYAPIVMKNPEDYEARANIMWASTIGLGGLLSCGKLTDWATHMIAHELSAFYNLTHGVALAILFPNWMKRVADESRLWRFRDYAVNVWGLSPELSDRELADGAIAKTREFFNSLGLPATLSQVNINDERFEIMAKNVVRRGSRGSFKVLDEEDVVAIYKMSL